VQPTTAGNGTPESAATSAPNAIVNAQVNHGAAACGTMAHPTVIPASHAGGRANSTQRPQRAPRRPASSVSASTGSRSSGVSNGCVSPS